jgi:hypothetical protein
MTANVDQRLEEAAQLFDTADGELEQAAKHCQTAARHFRDREIPRGGAHAWAAFGHIRRAEDALDAHARVHAERSNP